MCLRLKTLDLIVPLGTFLFKGPLHFTSTTRTEQEQNIEQTHKATYREKCTHLTIQKESTLGPVQRGLLVRVAMTARMRLFPNQTLWHLIALCLHYAS